MSRVIRTLASSWGFLGTVLALYVIAGMLSPASGLLALEASWGILVSLAPVLLLVFAIMVVANAVLRPEQLRRHLGEGSGFKGWLIAIGGGILSAGPIYLWYPLLSDLKEAGMRDSLIAAFLYNRAVKIPLLPAILFYFGWAFTVLVSVLMVAFSVASGILVERLARR